MIRSRMPRERERWYALLLTQGWTGSAVAETLERDPHTVGRWAAAFGDTPQAAKSNTVIQEEYEQDSVSETPG